MHGDHKSSKHRELMEKVGEVKETVFSLSSFVAKYDITNMSNMDIYYSGRGQAAGVNAEGKRC